eukprot:CAMPEP_0115831828 /NCGR_PEP_ID=MMETSP0287-20121206/2340_1 /TAXON_ID=412157 /ORGANISM="Chrysochromulina rotalis, Strain UIO044" /LENGTH=184 /DNA_ID=CAMNT_0003285187 /DNA_START=196 /DNA_END=750 /DNA_ORIENTATION=-
MALQDRCRRACCGKRPASGDALGATLNDVSRTAAGAVTLHPLDGRETTKLLLDGDNCCLLGRALESRRDAKECQHAVAEFRRFKRERDLLAQPRAALQGEETIVTIREVLGQHIGCQPASGDEAHALIASSDGLGAEELVKVVVLFRVVSDEDDLLACCREHLTDRDDLVPPRTFYEKLCYECL